MTTLVSNSVPHLAKTTSDETPMPVKIISSAAKKALNMTTLFGAIYGLQYSGEKIGDGFSKVTSLVYDGISYMTSNEIINNDFNATAYEEMLLERHVKKMNFAMLATLTISIQPIARQCFQHLLNCKEDTPLRNIAAAVGASLSSTTLASLACNQLGYETDTSMMIYKQLIGMCLIPASIGLCIGIDHLTKYTENIVDDSNSDELIKDHSKKLNSSRVHLFPDLTTTKTESIKQQLLLPLDQQLLANDSIINPTCL